MADYVTMGIPVRCRDAMYEFGLDANSLFGSRGWAIREVRVYNKRRVWQAFPSRVAPPRAGEKVWGILSGQLIAIDGETCGDSYVHRMATIMHKLMQQAAFKTLDEITTRGSPAIRRAFNAVCDVGLLKALEGFATGGCPMEQAALNEQLAHAFASCASVSPSDFRSAVRWAYGSSGILRAGAEDALCVYHDWAAKSAR